LLTPLFAPDASRVLDDLERNPALDRLLEAVWDTIDLISEQPTSREARRRAIRSPKGHSVWMVRVPNRHTEEPWIVLWQPQGEDALIAYIGPDNFGKMP